MIVSVLGRQRVILEDGCYHKDVWQGIVESSLLGCFYASGNVCNLAPF